MHLPWNVPDWSWLKPWEWPEHFLKWAKSWKEFREAAHRARIASIEADLAEAGKRNALFEVLVADKMREIRRVKTENAKPNIVVDVQPGQNENMEVFTEAMRRIKNEDQPSITLRQRG
jgi:hypothetical protein